MRCLDSVGEFGGARQVAVAPRVVFDSPPRLKTEEEQQAREAICRRSRKGKHTRSRGRSDEGGIMCVYGHDCYAA
jgi:hypothetical protein